MQVVIRYYVHVVYTFHNEPIQAWLDLLLVLVFLLSPMELILVLEHQYYYLTLMNLNSIFQ